MTRAMQPDVADVLASAAEGDETSFALIVVAFDDEIYRVCTTVCRDQAIAAVPRLHASALLTRLLATKIEPRGKHPTDEVAVRPNGPSG